MAESCMLWCNVVNEWYWLFKNTMVLLSSQHQLSNLIAKNQQHLWLKAQLMTMIHTIVLRSSISPSDLPSHSHQWRSGPAQITSSQDWRIADQRSEYKYSYEYLVCIHVLGVHSTAVLEYSHASPQPASRKTHSTIYTVEV